MKTAGILRSALALLALAVAASAKPKSKVEVNVAYDEVTVESTRWLDKGRIGLVLKATGKCWTDSDAHDPGVAIGQRFVIAINIDHTSAGIVGRTTGTVTGPMLPAGREFKAQVRGKLSNFGGGSCDLSLRATTGSIHMALAGEVGIDRESREITINGLDGTIVLRFGGQDLGE